MKPFKLAIPISKIDEEKREVWGYATVEELDKQGEIVDYEASKKAFSSWPGNIREMHDPTRAIGKKIEVAFDDDNKGVWVGAKISQSADGTNAWQKIKEGILTGFSIGGKVVDFTRDVVKDSTGDKEVNRITDYELSELSVVDNPAAPSATLQVVKSMGGKLYEAEVLERVNDPWPDLWWMKYYQIEPKQLINKSTKGDNITEKREFSDKQREHLASTGAALPDGSFPIENEEDLKNAIHAIGRAKDPAKAKEHIISRAKSLGAEELLPEEWKASSKSMRTKDMNKDMYNVRSGGKTAQDDVEMGQGTQLKERGEMGAATDGGGRGNNPFTPSETRDARAGDSQPMYNVRNTDPESAQTAIRPSNEAYETAENTAFSDPHDGEQNQELESLLSRLLELIGRDRSRGYEKHPRVMSGGIPHIVNSAPVEFAKAVAHELRKPELATDQSDMTKAFDTRLAEVERQFADLKELVDKIASQPAAPAARKGSFVTIDKSVDEDTVETELKSLLKKADEAASSTSMSMNERQELILKIRQAQRAMSKS